MDNSFMKMVGNIGFKVSKLKTRFCTWQKSISKLKWFSSLHSLHRFHEQFHIIWNGSLTSLLNLLFHCCIPLSAQYILLHTREMITIHVSLNLLSYPPTGTLLRQPLRNKVELQFLQASWTLLCKSYCTKLAVSIFFWNFSQ